MFALIFCGHEKRMARLQVCKKRAKTHSCITRLNQLLFDTVLLGLNTIHQHQHPLS